MDGQTGRMMEEAEEAEEVDGQNFGTMEVSKHLVRGMDWMARFYSRHRSLNRPISVASSGRGGN